MSIISGYADDASTSDNDKFLTLNSSGTTTLTPASTLKSYIFAADTGGGWTDISGTISAATYNGNRSYSLTTSADLSASLSPGMRFRTTRTVAAPTRSTSLNGTSQYFSKTSPAGMTFTDDFVVSAWVKPTSYAAGNIISRYNGTSGWRLAFESDGRLTLLGYNAGAGNYSLVQSYQSLPLNKWTHITMQLDMSAFTATTTTSYIMLDGVDVPATVLRGGTNPTALVQAGDLQIGAANTTLFFPGKIAQAAVFNAKVTQATIRGYISQGLSGSETSLISAYSFDGSSNDKNTTNANNLTANGSATTTNADSPFGGLADGTISSTKDFAIIQKVTSTTLTVQVAEGCTIATSGGITSASYSNVKAPYGFPGQADKWRIEVPLISAPQQATAAANTWYNINSLRLDVPIGSFTIGYMLTLYATRGSSSAGVFVDLNVSASPGTISATQANARMLTSVYNAASGSTAVDALGSASKSIGVTTSTSTPYYLLFGGSAADVMSIAGTINRGVNLMYMDNAYL